MAKNEKITITVEGSIGSGKGTVMRDVMECLANLGYTVSVHSTAITTSTVMERSRLSHAQSRLMLEERQDRGELTVQLEERTTPSAETV